MYYSFIKIYALAKSWIDQLKIKASGKRVITLNAFHFVVVAWIYYI